MSKPTTDGDFRSFVEAMQIADQQIVYIPPHIEIRQPRAKLFMELGKLACKS